MNHLSRLFGQKQYRYAAVVTIAFILAVAGFLKLSGLPPQAQASGTYPTVTFTPAYDPTNSNGDINGGQLTISGSGPFTEDFKVTLCLFDKSGNAGEQCASTPWASQAAAPGTSQMSDAHDVPEFTAANASIWWSNWAGSSHPGPWGPPNSGSYITVQTQPLSAGESINDVQLGLQFITNQGSVDNGPQCLEQVGGNHVLALPDTNWGSGVFAHPDSAIYTPLGEGTSVSDYDPGAYGNDFPGAAYGWQHEACADPKALTNVSDYFRIYMSGESYNAVGVSNNIPATFNTSQTMTNGSDGNPMEITVENTGGSPWISDQSTVIAGSHLGTCDGTDGEEPTTGHTVGTFCTVSLNNYSDVFELQHVSGSFGVGSNPAQYSQVSQQTCTVSSTQACNVSSCSDQGSCEVPNGGGYCAGGSGYCSDQSSCTEPAEYGGCGGTWEAGCGGTWGNSIQCTTTGGDPNVEPGATTTFLLGSLTAPSTPGNDTETWQMEDGAGNPFGNTIPISITVAGGTPPLDATVNVASEDSQTGSAVTSSFDVLDGASDLCGTSSCQAQNQSFNNIPLGVPVFVNAVSNSTGNSFAFGGVREQLPIAQKKTDILSKLFALSKNLLFGEANAQEYCTYIGTGSGCPAPVTMGTPGFGIDSLTPDNSIPADLTDNFVILWDPEASMSVSPSSVSNSLSGSGTVGTVTVSNSSTAPGAELGWSSSVSYTSGNNNWLSVTPSADASGLEDGSSDTATIAYTGGLSPETYHANVTIIGDPLSGGSLNPPSVTIPVTLTVTNGSGGPYFSCASNQCAETATPGATSCDAACGLPSGTTPAAKCAPNSITTAETSQCMLDLNGIPQNNVAWAIASGSSGSVNNSGVYTPSGTGTETIVGTLPDGTSAWNARRFLYQLMCEKLV